MKLVDNNSITETRWLLVYSGALIVGALALGIVVVGRRHLEMNGREQPLARPAPGRTSMVSSVLLAAARKDATAPGDSDSYKVPLRPNKWLDVSPVRRAIAMSPEVMAPYETILAALEIPPNRLRRLKELIVEWTESGSDADDLGKENRLGAETISAARKVAEASVEREMEEVVGAAKFGIVREMIELTPQLTDIAHFAGRNLSSHGIPLSAEQMLSLAEIYRDAYVGSPTDPSVDRGVGFEPPTGLGDADRRVLTSAATVLSLVQLETLHRSLAATRYATQP